MELSFLPSFLVRVISLCACQSVGGMCFIESMCRCRGGGIARNGIDLWIARVFYSAQPSPAEPLTALYPHCALTPPPFSPLVAPSNPSEDLQA